MRITRLTSPKVGALDGASPHFGAVWEVELEGGEATRPYQHPRLEEIYCCVEGHGEIYVRDERHALVRGQVFFVPRETHHWLENPTDALMRCLAVESPVLPEPRVPEKVTIPDMMQRLEQQIDALPSELDRVAAIQHIVSLFDVAGHLSEQIEDAFGLDNEDGVSALTKIEDRIMRAVVEITRRYERGQIDLGGFGGRLKDLR